MLENWRFQQALYRAYYDAYVRGRLLYEEALEEQANDALRRAVETGRDALLALAEAEAILDRAVTQPIAWRTRLFRIPAAAIHGGELMLTWETEHGRGGNPGGAGVCEVWLLKR